MAAASPASAIATHAARRGRVRASALTPAASRTAHPSATIGTTRPELRIAKAAVDSFDAFLTTLPQIDGPSYG